MLDYLIHIAIIINIYIIITVSTNLLVGVANLMSLGQAAFYGISAYLSVLMVNKFNLPLIVAIIFIMIINGMISLLIAFPSLKLTGDYFLLATLGFQLIIFSILYNWISLTRGPYGITGISSPIIWNGIYIKGAWSFLILSIFLSVSVIYIFKKFLDSPFGRALKAVRDDEHATISLGRNVAMLKIWTFVLSCSFIGISGFLYSTYIKFIDPTSFNLDESIFILAAVLIGGTGNIIGPITGALFVVLLPEALRFIGFPSSVAANLRQIIYGIIIIILMRFRPQGLMGKFQPK